METNGRLPLYGFYSADAAEKFGVVFYSTPTGGEVAVTAVYYDKEAADYGFPDKRFVGEVVEFIRSSSRAIDVEQESSRSRLEKIR